MKLQSLLLVALSCAPFLACAGQTYRADIGPMLVMPRGDIALQNATGTVPPDRSQNDIDSDLGLGDTEAVPYLRLETDIGRHRIRAHGFGLDAEGSGRLNGDFGGLASGSQVTTSMEFYSVVANWSYRVLGDRRYRLALGAQAGAYWLDVAARSPLGREEVETSVVVPMPFIEGELFYGDFAFGANFGVMAGDFGDGNGRYLDFEAYSKWQIDETFDVMAGYRHMVLDAYGRASSRDFDADIDMQGVFLTGGIRF